MYLHRAFPSPVLYFSKNISWYHIDVKLFRRITIYYGIILCAYLLLMLSALLLARLAGLWPKRNKWPESMQPRTEETLMLMHNMGLMSKKLLIRKKNATAELIYLIEWTYLFFFSILTLRLRRLVLLSCGTRLLSACVAMSFGSSENRLLDWGRDNIFPCWQHIFLFNLFSPRRNGKWSNFSVACSIYSLSTPIGDHLEKSSRYICVVK